MKRFVLPALLLLLVALATPAWALDSVKRLSGTNVSGTIKTITKNEVEIEKTAGGAEKIPVTDVEAVFFDGEPTSLRQVRTSATNGDFGNALTAIQRIEATPVARADVKGEIEFWKGWCNGRLALAGSGDVKKAGGDLVKFTTAYPNNFHFYAATELIGDLLVKDQNYTAAATFYSQLAAAPFPEYKMRAGNGVGRAAIAQKDFPKAQSEFDSVLALTAQAKGDVANSQRFAATLGKAICLSETGKVDESIKQIEEVIAGVSPENTELMSQAYVTLGKCYLKKPEAKKQALLAFLHVDMLYSGQPAAHAEALRELDKLWRDLGKPERALQAIEILKSRYTAAGSGQ